MAAPVVVTVDGDCCCTGIPPPPPCFGSACGCDITGPFVARLLSFGWDGGTVTVPAAVGCVTLDCDVFAGTNETGMGLDDGSRLVSVNFGFACIELNYGPPCNGTVLAFYFWALIQLPTGDFVTLSQGGVSGFPVPPAGTIANATRTPGGGFDGPCDGFCLSVAPWCGGPVCDVDSFLGTYVMGGPPSGQTVTLARGRCA
jgi:hypothetical protein